MKNIKSFGCQLSMAGPNLPKYQHNNIQKYCLIIVINKIQENIEIIFHYHTPLLGVKMIIQSTSTF